MQFGDSISTDDYKYLKALDEITDGMRKIHALMTILGCLIARHHEGAIVLDDTSFKLFELAKRINSAEDSESLQNVLSDLRKFNK